MKLRNSFAATHWWMLGLTVILFLAVGFFVDLKPQVGANFFFSSSDPQFKEEARIDQLFPSRSQLILNVAAPSISSSRYLDRLGRMTTELARVKSVASLESLTDGPTNLADAEKSPFWRRLLITEKGRSSNVLMFVSTKDTQGLIADVEAIMAKFQAKDFDLHLAGAAYVAEMIRRNLAHDFLAFTFTSILLFGAAMWALFRSAKLTLGMLATCSSAVLVTLIVQSLGGEKIGILTANLTTIVFVVALSHLVYMTFNWQTLAQEGEEDAGQLASKAWRMTLPASSWSMVCASLGFGSLLLVPAKPLRELGIGGTLGTVIALGCAYLMYPSFLAWAKAPAKSSKQAKTSSFWERRYGLIVLATVLVAAGLSIGMTRLDTDPSLLDYFAHNREPRQGLEFIDRNGGANPLTLVVEAADGSRLDSKQEYQKMWSLQEALEDHKGVGEVLSLPVLMEEANQHPFAFLLSWNRLLKILDEPKHARVASSFATKDRKLAAYYLRMEEQKRDKPRIDVVNDLRKVVRANGFKVALVGGVYELQGQLAQMVAHSLISGLSWLFVFFTGVALIVARNVRVALAMIVSLALVPVCVLGAIGLFNIPVDIISAPATNVCIGMAIDSMVHLVFAMRRAQKSGSKGWDAWVVGRQEQWRGIVYSDVIIAAGFAIFALSHFPPTQRFGLVVVAGTAVDILANLFVLPLLAGAPWPGRKALHPAATA